MFKRKKPSSATTSTIFVNAPSSATAPAILKKQRFDNVAELGDVTHQSKKKLPTREFGKKIITK